MKPVSIFSVFIFLFAIADFANADSSMVCSFEKWNGTKFDRVTSTVLLVYENQSGWKIKVDPKSFLLSAADMPNSNVLIDAVAKRIQATYGTSLPGPLELPVFKPHQ
ncbi:MAG: hypothetical protein ACK5W9_01340 [Bdellovibrionales bacterium]